MDVSSLFIADPQLAELIEPCQGPLHIPPPPPEPAAVRSLPLSQPRLDLFARSLVWIFSAS